MPFCALLHAFRSLVGLSEYEEAYEEHKGQSSYSDVGASRLLAYEGNQQGSRKGRSLSADVVNAEVLAGFFRRNDFGVI